MSHTGIQRKFSCITSSTLKDSLASSRPAFHLFIRPELIAWQLTLDLLSPDIYSVWIKKINFPKESSGLGRLLGWSLYSYSRWASIRPLFRLMGFQTSPRMKQWSDPVHDPKPSIHGAWNSLSERRLSSQPARPLWICCAKLPLPKLHRLWLDPRRRLPGLPSIDCKLLSSFDYESSGRSCREKCSYDARIPRRNDHVSVAATCGWFLRPSSETVLSTGTYVGR